MDRKQKVKDLLEILQSMKRTVVFQTTGTVSIPRITPSQWGVLMLIDKLGQSTVKEIAGTLNITSSATTQLIDGLVSSGYVTREENAEDRRRVELRLSKKTKSQVEKMKSKCNLRFLKLFEILSDSELEQYIMLNKKIVTGTLNK